MSKLLNFKKVEKPVFKLNNAATSAEIIMYGAIGEDWWDDAAMSAVKFNEELKKLPSSVSEIVIRLNSPGGNVFDGMTIYERLKQHKAKVTVYVDGLAASIASVIALAGDEIIIGDGAMMMIHKPLAGVYGNSEELLKMIDLLDKVEEQLITIYSKKMDKSRIEIAKMLSDTTWFTSDESVEAGLADTKFENCENLYIAASMLDKAHWLKDKPKIKSMNDVVREKLKQVQKDAEGFLAR